MILFHNSHFHFLSLFLFVLNIITQISFWDEILKPVPNFDQLECISRSMHTSFRKAQFHFQEMLCINSSSPLALRSYGLFLLDIANDQIMGQDILQRADALEDSQARARSHVHDVSGDLDMFDGD